MKPTLYVANSSNSPQGYEELNGEKILALDVKIESELAELTDEERAEYMKELGITESLLDRLAKA
jgi:ribosome-binding ATPase YchF (GTP1/OBG family)